MLSAVLSVAVLPLRSFLMVPMLPVSSALANWVLKFVSSFAASVSWVAALSMSSCTESSCLFASLAVPDRLIE